MCKAVEDMMQKERMLGETKGRAEGKAEGKVIATLENAKAFLKAGLATPEQVAEVLNLPIAQVKKLAEELQ